MSQLKCELQQSVEDQVKNQIEESAKNFTRILAYCYHQSIRFISLVANLDKPWLDREGAESFLKLAELGISDSHSSSSIHQVARVCFLLARASGPCRYFSISANQVHNRLSLGSSEVVLQFINLLEELYMKLKDQPTAKDSFQCLFRLANSAAFDDTVTILLLFSNTSNLHTIWRCYYELFAQDTSSRKDWQRALREMPIDLQLYPEICSL